MPWSYKLHVVQTSAGWTLEVEDPTNERELVRRFETAGAAAEHAEALRRQLIETGDVADIIRH